MSPPKTDEYCSSSQEIQKVQCGEHRLLMTTLKEIRENVNQIKESLSNGQAIFAKLQVRIDHLEKVVYGIAGAGMLSLLGAILALVFRK